MNTKYILGLAIYLLILAICLMNGVSQTDIDNCSPSTCFSTDPCIIAACGPSSICIQTLVNCDDGDACTTDSCINGQCTNNPINCDDPDPCTDDFCIDGVCHNPKRPDCCIDDSQCVSDDPCKVGTCTPPGICVYLEIVHCRSKSDRVRPPILIPPVLNPGIGHRPVTPPMGRW